MPFGVGDDPTVLPGREIAEAGEIQRRPFHRLALELDRQPLRTRLHDQRFGGGKLCPPVRKGGRRDDPGGTGGREAEVDPFYRFFQRKGREIESGGGTGEFGFPHWRGVGQRHGRAEPVVAIPPGDDRHCFAAPVLVTELDGAERLEQHRRPGGGVEEIEIFRLFRKVCDIDSGGLRAELPAENQAGASVIAAGIGYVDPDAVETVFAGLKRARFLRRALTGPGGCSFARTESAVEEGGKVDRLRVDAGAGEMQLEIEFQFPEFHRFRVFSGREEPELVILFAVPEKLPDEDEVAVPGDGERPLRILHGDGLGGCVEHLFRLVLLRHGDRFPVDLDPDSLAERQIDAEEKEIAGDRIFCGKFHRIVEGVRTGGGDDLVHAEGVEGAAQFKPFRRGAGISGIGARLILRNRFPLRGESHEGGPATGVEHQRSVAERPHRPFEIRLQHQRQEQAENETEGGKVLYHERLH